jgi:hypothetical protein
MKKANKHDRPEIYRITFRCGGWVSKSERFYNVFHSSEALEDICHVFYKGTIPCRKITIYDIEEYVSYANQWTPRLEYALDNIENIDVELLDVKKDKIILRKS